MRRLLAVLVAALVLAPTASAYPIWWRKQARCIRWQESRDLWHLNTGNSHYGAYQFLKSTWRAHVVKGWPTNPAKASPAQQTLVTWRVWRANGRRWSGQWSTSTVCGVQ